MFIKIFVYLVLVLSLPFSTTSATTYYVSRDTGNDYNSGLNWYAAFKSLDKAARSTHPGDTVVIRRSTTPYKFLKIHNSGISGKPIKFIGESGTEPPVISGAILTSNWKYDSKLHCWVVNSRIEPARLSLGEKMLVRSSTDSMNDGDWYWKQGKLMLNSILGNPNLHQVWSLRNGGGIAVAGHSWIDLENIECWLGRGACISIKGGAYNVARHIHAQWQWRGLDITDGGHQNLLEDSLFEENREGIYIRNHSHDNTVRNTRVTNNGRYPLWKKGDRHAVAIGEHGPNNNNRIENCEIIHNGGPPDNVALIAFRAPGTVFANNDIHDNYGSGLFVTTGSNDSLIMGNYVRSNGQEAAAAGISGIAGLSVRNSRNVQVTGNLIIDNYVTKDSIYRNIYRGPRGGLEVEGHNKVNMQNITISDNRVSGTIGGPDIYISERPDTSGLYLQPSPDAVPASTFRQPEK